MSKTYRSDALTPIHETASDLHDAGIMGKRTLRDFEGLCLAPVRAMTAADIRALRTRERVSQAVFARYLNVTTAWSASGSGREAPDRRLAQAADPGRPARPRSDRVAGEWGQSP